MGSWKVGHNWVTNTTKQSGPSYQSGPFLQFQAFSGFRYLKSWGALHGLPAHASLPLSRPSRPCCCFLIAQHSIYCCCSSIIDSDYYCFVLPRKGENVPLLYSLLPRLTWTLKQNNLCSKPFKIVWQIVCLFQFCLGLRTNIWQMWTCYPLSPFLWSLLQASFEPTSSLFLQRCGRPQGHQLMWVPLCQQVSSDLTPILHLASTKTSVSSMENKASLH